MVIDSSTLRKPCGKYEMLRVNPEPFDSASEADLAQGGEPLDFARDTFERSPEPVEGRPKGVEPQAPPFMAGNVERERRMG